MYRFTTAIRRVLNNLFRGDPGRHLDLLDVVGREAFVTQCNQTFIYKVKATHYDCPHTEQLGPVVADRDCCHFTRNIFEEIVTWHNWDDLSLGQFSIYMDGYRSHSFEGLFHSDNMIKEEVEMLFKTWAECDCGPLATDGVCDRCAEVGVGAGGWCGCRDRCGMVEIEVESIPWQDWCDVRRQFCTDHDEWWIIDISELMDGSPAQECLIGPYKSLPKNPASAA